MCGGANWDRKMGSGKAALFIDPGGKMSMAECFKVFQ